VLVVEAGEKSGSLITVRHALEQGKTVYVVPGRVDRPEAIGCLRLLVDGATPAIEPDDVLPALGSRTAVPEPASKKRRRLDGPLGERLEALFREEDSWHPDTIAEKRAPAALIRRATRLRWTLLSVCRAGVALDPGGRDVRRGNLAGWMRPRAAPVPVATAGRFDGRAETSYSHHAALGWGRRLDLARGRVEVGSGRPR
jgi:hypothetical protein